MNKPFSQYLQQQILPLVEQFPIQYLTGEQGCQLAYRHLFHQEGAKSLLILLSGRAENLRKYSELAYEFFQRGDDVLLLDHRGQGYSQRLLKDPEKGYVDNFSFYAKDLDRVVRHIGEQFAYSKQYLLAHSLGALIATDYLAHYDHHVQKAVFSAPFFGVPYRRQWLDELLVSLMLLANKGQNYVFGKGPYQPVNIDENRLSASPERMQFMNQIIQQQPELRLGGPTFHWLHLAANAIAKLPAKLRKIEIPVLVLQAEQELIVNNKTLEKTTALLPQGKHILIEKAKHEILFEADEIRTPALQQILDFLQ